MASQISALPPKKRQELEILQRTKTLLFAKLEKLLDQQVDVDKINAASIDPALTSRVEELSTYIDRVEEQIKKLRAAEASQETIERKPLVNNLFAQKRADSALAVADLMMGPQQQQQPVMHEPPLTERQSMVEQPAPLDYNERLQTMATPKDGRSFEERNNLNNYLEEVSQTSLAEDSQLLKDQFADLTRIPVDLIEQSKSIEDFLNSRRLRDSEADCGEERQENQA